MACAVAAETASCANGPKKPAENGTVTVERTPRGRRSPSRLRMMEEGGGQDPPQRNGHVRREKRKSVPTVPKPMPPIEEDDIRPPPSKCCCDRISVQKACRFVAFMSLLAAISNAILYFFGLSWLGLSAPTEIIIMILDFIAAICLLIGATNGSPSMLKPYLFFMALWSFGLILLLVSCLWKLITNRHFANNAINNLMDVTRSGDYQRIRHARHGQEGFELLLAFCLVASLALVIVIDCVFLHVAYRAFQHFAYRKDRSKQTDRIVL